jgi:hypothetical protein
LSGTGFRANGAASAALRGAVEHITTLARGRVEGYPEDVTARKASPAFPFNGASSTFDRLGFERSRLVGKHKSVMTRTVA